MHVDVITDGAPATHVRAAAQSAAPPVDVAHVATPAPVVGPTSRGSKAPLQTTTWRELAARGANDAAYAKLGRNGVASAVRAASVDELFALADVIRLAGHPAEAVAPLERIVTDYPDDPRTALAALTLGRIELHSLDAPRAAARALEVAIARGVPMDLAEDANAMRIEALAKAGDLQGARAAFARFAERFPTSTRLREMNVWLRDR